ncbi:MAG: dephospho-CoA kinase [Candidatus Kaelpia aquatica]|nr:dephospho-CoA kinase [Candidatus Kaelpia aquatica]
MPKSSKIIIAITGEIGAGKTTYAEEFEKHGAHPVYTDAIAHEILKFDEVKSLIEKKFGRNLLQDNGINPKMLADRAFKDRVSWQRLIDITHPYILKKTKEIIAESRSDYCVIDAPLLFESKLDKDSDFIILIKADTRLRKRRLEGRMNWEEAKKRASYLIPIKEKERLADIVIDNNSKEKRKVKENVEKIFRRIKSRRS